MNTIAHNHPDVVSIVDDTLSNGTWAAGQIIYYEGNNILVSIRGQNPDLDAVLFSAHFDSVSTAPGKPLTLGETWLA